MRVLHILSLLLATLLLLSPTAKSDKHQATAQRQAIVIPLTGAIGPASREFVVRQLEIAVKQGDLLAILQIDTPGGLDLAMRDIIKVILSSPIPVVSYVSPAGGRAASAGTYILYASHVAAMAPATNLGAATPVSVGGAPGSPDSDDTPDSQPAGSQDEQERPQATEPVAGNQEAMRRKVVNDAVAYIRGLAELRGRNADWAEKAVREGVSLSANDALEQQVIDIVAVDMADLLAQLDGRSVTVKNQSVTLDTEGVVLVRAELDWRSKLLAVITNPNVAYMLLIIGFYGIIFEFYSPGLGFPGILGAICLLLGFYALQMLPISYAGLGLILLGLGLMAAEALMPSFGIFGVGGVCAFVIGSLLLMDTELPGFQIALPLVAGITTVSMMFFLWVMRKAISIRRRAAVTGSQMMIGQEVNVDQRFIERGQIEVGGEIWSAEAENERALQPGDTAVITAVDGLKLHIKPKN